MHVLFYSLLIYCDIMFYVMNIYKFQKADSPIAPKLFSQVSYLQYITTLSKYSCQSQEKEAPTEQIVEVP